MVTQNPREIQKQRKRGVIAVQVAVILAVLVGFAALTIDVGAMYNTRADLQRSVDAAALAGAAAYTTDEMMQVRMNPDDADALGYVVSLANELATDGAAWNPSLGTTTTSVDNGDILTGWINLNSTSETIHTNPQPNEYNAVQVFLRRQLSEQEGANPPIALFFARIFGKQYAETATTAVAAFDDRFSGISVSEPGAGFLPFTIHEDAFASELAFGGDQYGWDPDTETVYEGADGIREIRLYPYPLSGDPDSWGDGNFGVLNIGSTDQGLLQLRDQIMNGVSAEDLEAEIGTSNPTFYDDDGNPITYDITGSPGLDAGLVDAIESIEGQIVGFFLHNDVILSGANSIYTITAIRFGRLMDIRLYGAPDTRGLYIQPAIYAGGNVQVDEDAPSSGGLVGRLVLVR
jgi:Flp pilus assembly protein TadG